MQCQKNTYLVEGQLYTIKIGNAQRWLIYYAICRGQYPVTIIRRIYIDVKNFCEIKRGVDSNEYIKCR